MEVHFGTTVHIDLIGRTVQRHYPGIGVLGYVTLRMAHLRGRVPLAQILKETVAPTAIGIGTVLVALLLLLGWGIVATLLCDYRSMKATISEREKEVERLQTELDKADQRPVTADPWLSLLHVRQGLEAELQKLREIEEAGIKTVPTVKIGKDESDYRKEQIERLKRDIEDISKRLALEGASKDTDTGLPTYRPVVVPHEYGQQEHKSSGRPY